MSERKTIVTYTGKIIDPLNLTADDIDIADIAHALSNICRFNGHVDTHYSVAEHSVRVMDACSHYKLHALLHDASEAYLLDVPLPVKDRTFFGTAAGVVPYRLAEAWVMDRISRKFIGCDWMMPDVVDLWDRELLTWELRDLKGVEVEPCPFDEELIPWSCDRARARFLAAFYELTGGF